ncbi:DUF4030 domain-containing protein [Peribacillus frigoritolerans]|uniref:DUF4030 domain-containing protein n=1 Tax=Peribacillus frigoritolerans TaxID=450367 RepID=UPI0024C103B1|nr:DUF4030 domain-containing protein [Peribacillus frigoritolerans]WHX66290.1 DUF4030 domain-containing protein [Peribacillus frigoritolerans]
MKKQYEDTDLDISLKKLNADLLWKTKQKQELKKRIISDIEKLESQERNKNPILSTRIRKVSLIRKLAYSGIALIILFGLFISSAFVSPAMAKVASKIPYLGQIFENKNNIVLLISEELRAKGYKKTGVGVSFPKKEIEIAIQGSEKYFNDVKSDVDDITKDILKSKGYDAYTVKVSRYTERVDVPHSEEDKKQLEILLSLDKASEKYKLLGIGILAQKIVEVEIPDTEKRTDEIEQYVQNIIQLKTNDQYTVKFKKVNMKKREQEGRWSDILDTVSEDLLGKKDYNVRMVGYSVHPEPEIQMFITLSRSDENAKAFAQQLEKIIDDFLQSEQMKSRVKNDPYHITIFDKDDKIIN